MESGVVMVAGHTRLPEAHHSINSRLYTTVQSCSLCTAWHTNDQIYYEYKYVNGTQSFDVEYTLDIVKKANSTRAFHTRCNPRCCRKVKQMAHNAYISPTVEYASPVWDPHTKRNTNKIEMVQRRCARYVTINIDRTSSLTSLLNCTIFITMIITIIIDVVDVYTVSIISAVIAILIISAIVFYVHISLLLLFFSSQLL